MDQGLPSAPAPDERCSRCNVRGGAATHIGPLDCIGALRLENAHLRTDREAQMLKVVRQKNALAGANDRVRALKNQRAPLQNGVDPDTLIDAECAALRHALEWYAEPGRYEDPPPDAPAGWSAPGVLLDRGKRARAALAATGRGSDYLAQKQAAERRVDAQKRQLTRYELRIRQLEEVAADVITERDALAEQIASLGETGGDVGRRAP